MEAFWGALHVAVGGTDVHAASFHVCSLQPLAHYCLHCLTVWPLRRTRPCGGMRTSSSPSRSPACARCASSKATLLAVPVAALLGARSGPVPIAQRPVQDAANAIGGCRVSSGDYDRRARNLKKSSRRHRFHFRPDRARRSAGWMQHFGLHRTKTTRRNGCEVSRSQAARWGTLTNAAAAQADTTAAQRRAGSRCGEANDDTEHVAMAVSGQSPELPVGSGL